MQESQKKNMDQVNIIVYLYAVCKCLSVAPMNCVFHSVIVCFNWHHNVMRENEQRRMLKDNSQCHLLEKRNNLHIKLESDVKS